MLAGLTFGLIAILALLLRERHWRARGRGELPKYRDLDELNEVVNGILKRERGRAGKERAEHSRESARGSSADDAPVVAPRVSREGGGVIRSKDALALRR